MKTLEIYYDYVSPWSYVAHKRLPGALEGLEVDVQWKPVFLGAVMDATSNRPPASVPAKFNYMMRDIGRYLQRYEIPMDFNPHFPMRTVDALRAALLAQDEGVFDVFHDAVYEAVWVQRKKIADAEVFAEVLRDAGLDASIVERAGEPEIKARLIQETEDAVERGIFGAPTFFVGDEMFWGQDRLEWVRRELSS